MLLTLALVVLGASIFVFFSEEFLRTFKKILSLKGGKIVFPIAIASWLVYMFNPWLLWVIYYCREVLQAILSLLTPIMPFYNLASSIALVLLLTVVSVLPVFILDIIIHKKTYKHYRYPYLTSAIIWLILVILIIVL